MNYLKHKIKKPPYPSSVAAAVEILLKEVTDPAEFRDEVKAVINEHGNYIQNLKQKLKEKETMENDLSSSFDPLVSAENNVKADNYKFRW